MRMWLWKKIETENKDETQYAGLLDKLGCMWIISIPASAFAMFGHHSRAPSGHSASLKDLLVFAPRRKPWVGVRLSVWAIVTTPSNATYLTKNPSFVSQLRFVPPNFWAIWTRNCGGGWDPLVVKINLLNSWLFSAPSWSLSKVSNISLNTSASFGANSWCLINGSSSVQNYFRL